jgi:outer membrane protein OmpA-like peptidoglycan-associated protein
MKIMKKLSLIFILSLIINSVNAQLYGYKWRVGASVGTTNYIGDIRPFGLNSLSDVGRLYQRSTVYSEDLSYQFSLEYALGNSVGIMLTAGSYQFGSSDRYIENDGTLYRESNRFDRALNFRTDLIDAGLSFVLKPDNNWLLSGKSFLAPYLVVGMGVQKFDVFGDLLDENGNRYDYSNPNLIPDGSFETRLRDVETEVPGGYKKATLYAHLGMGIRFRITKGIELFAQSDFKRAATDYLDDVSGRYRNRYDNSFQRYAALPGTNTPTPDNPYRGNPNSKADWYIYHGMGIKFSLGANKESFNPPTVSQRYTYTPKVLSEKTEATADSIQKTEEAKLNLAPTVTNNYFTIVQFPGLEKSAPIIDTVRLDSIQKANIDRKIDSLKNTRAQAQANKDSLRNRLSQLSEKINELQIDSLNSKDSIQILINQFENQTLDYQKEISRIDSLDKVLVIKEDSLLGAKNTLIISKVDTAQFIEKILLYPGKVNKIIYSPKGISEFELDSLSNSQTGISNQQIPDTVKSTEVLIPEIEKSKTDAKPVENAQWISREDFEKEISKYREEMLKAQAIRDSAMLMAFSSRLSSIQSQNNNQEERTTPQQIVVNPENEETSKELERIRRRQERLERRNRELIKDAAIIGGTAATTAALNKNKTDENQIIYIQDSTLLDRITQDAILIDNLRKEASKEKVRIDTVEVEKVVENTKPILLEESKLEVYFGINQSELSEEEKAKLLRLKEILETNPQLGLELIGFADNTGSVSYNLRLVEKRVNSVKKQLIELGIDQKRIFKDSGGLILRGASKGSVDKDRKVEIRLTSLTSAKD